VSSIADGDSIVLGDGREVRYLGVDAPEREEAFSEEAREANGALVLGREVSLEAGGRETLDAYDRILAVVYTPGESGRGRICVNGELVRRGLASVYLKGTDAPDGAFLEAILRAQREAIAEGRGLWPGRLAAAGKVGEPLVATRFRIHRASCEALGSARVTRVLDIRKEFEKGKSLCRSCRPLGTP
jgi:micrococcal nuclease